jgi:uncharacterized protein YxjI
MNGRSGKEMLKDTVKMIERVRQSNEEQKVVRVELPDLLEAFQEWKKGNREPLGMYFYEEQKVMDANTKNPYINGKLKFWDNTLNNKLYMLRKEFTKYNDAPPYAIKVEGKSMRVKERHTLMSEDDFMQRFYEYLLVGNKVRKDGKCFADFIDIEYRLEGDRTEQLQILREYILIYFGRDLKHILDAEKGIKTRYIDKKVYRIEPQIQTVSIEDVSTYGNSESFDEENNTVFENAVTGYSGDGILDHVAEKENEDIVEGVSRYNYLKYNWRNLLTKNQVERMEKLIKYIELHPTENIPEMFDEFTEELVQSKLKDIWFGDELESANDSTLRSKVSEQLENIRRTMDKKLKKFEKDLSRPENRLKSTYYIEGLSQENNLLYHKYLRRWMSEDEKQQLSNETIPQLLIKYNIDDKAGQEFHYRKEPVKVYKPSSVGKVLFSDSDLEYMQQRRIEKIVEAIRSQDKEFTIEFYQNKQGQYEMFSKAKEKILLPMSEESYSELVYGDIRTKFRVVERHLNPNAYKVKAGMYKREKVKSKVVTMEQKTTYTNAIEFRNKKAN